MSFAPEFAPDAQSQWRELDVRLQELVLDEIENLLSNTPSAPASVIYHDFTCQHTDARHYIFLRAVLDRSSEKLTIIGLAHVQRPADRI